MKSTTLGMIAVLALALPACSSSDSSKKNDTAGAQTESVGSSEIISCKGKATTKLKYEDGKEETQVQESVTSGTRKYTGVSADGSKQYTFNGEYSSTTYTLAADQSLTYTSKYEYTYTSTGEKKRTQQADGTIKESGKYQRVMTAKAGSVLHDSEGNEITTKTDGSTFEDVIKVTGSKSVTVSSKYDGKDLPNYPYETETIQSGNKKYEMTTLTKPFTEKYEGLEMTNVSDEMLCTTETVK